MSKVHVTIDVSYDCEMSEKDYRVSCNIIGEENFLRLISKSVHAQLEMSNDDPDVSINSIAVYKGEGGIEFE